MISETRLMPIVKKPAQKAISVERCWMMLKIARLVCSPSPMNRNLTGPSQETIEVFTIIAAIATIAALNPINAADCCRLAHRSRRLLRNSAVIGTANKTAKNKNFNIETHSPRHPPTTRSRLAWARNNSTFGSV